MNIQGLNPLSLLSSADAASATAPGMAGEGANADLFSSALLNQLAQLQSSLLAKGAAGSKGLAELQQQFGGLGAETLSSQNMQDFAALFGKSLPMATKLNQDINLDDTLHTLADVLQYLQGLEATTTPAVQQSPVVSQKLLNQKDAADSEADDAEFASQQAVLAAGVSQVQSLPVADNSIGEALKTAVASSQAMSALKKSPELLGVDANKEALAAMGPGSEGQNGASVDGGVSKALAGQTAGQQFGQDASGNAFQGEQTTGLKNQIGNSDTDSSLSRMTADIAQLNKSVNNASHTAVPAMDKHLTHPDWNADLGGKLLWMYKQAIPSAELRLNPEHLGPISIKIDVSQDQASVAFTAQHAAVREAIEAAIPKLREMLGGQNLNLADVNVAQQQSEQRQGRESFQMAGDQNRGGNGQNQADSAAKDPASTIIDEIEAGRAIASNGLLSLFA